MKNFIMLTTENEGTKFCIPVSNIKLVDSTPVGTRVYFINEPIEWRYVKESVEEIAQKIKEATKEKAEFIDFLFVNNNERLCVKISEIRYWKAGEGKTHKVFIEGMGEIEVYGDFNKIVESLSSVTI